MGESANRRALVRDALVLGSRLFQLFFPQSVTLSFTVTTMKGKRLLLSDVRADSTVLDLLRTIADKEGLPSYFYDYLEFHLHLVRLGVPLLHGEQPLRECGVKTGDVLHCFHDLGRAARYGTIVGPYYSEWWVLWKRVHMLRCLPITLLRVRPFDQYAVPSYYSPLTAHFSPIRGAGRCEGEVHWRLRAVWPQRDVIWSPEHFAAWPLALPPVRPVPPEGGCSRRESGTLRPMPYDIAAFL